MRFLLATICLLAVAFAAPAQQPFRLGPVSVVATSEPGFRVFPGVSVSLRPDSSKVIQDPRFADEHLEAQFREAIMNGLVERGYRLAPPGESSYEVGFVLALSAEMSNTALLDELGFSPGLADARSDRFERGTLAVLLFEPDGGPVMWKGAIQAFADLEADPEVRRQRIQLATQRLLRALPTPPR